MAIAVPAGFGIALFLTELCPPMLKRPIGVAGRTARRGAEHHLRHLGAVRARAGPAAACSALADRACAARYPGIGKLFMGPPYGIGILTAGFVLAIMVLPFIAATMRDVFDTVPPMLKESGYGLGATTWEVIWNVVVPHSRVGIVGGIMLGLGRALGETMAVTFVIGNAHRISSSLLAPGTTISSVDRQRVHRSGRRPVHLVADCPGVAAVPHHLHRHRGGAGDAAPARAPSLVVAYESARLPQGKKWRLPGAVADRDVGGPCLLGRDSLDA